MADQILAWHVQQHQQHLQQHQQQQQLHQLRTTTKRQSLSNEAAVGKKSRTSVDPPRDPRQIRRDNREGRVQAGVLDSCLPSPPPPATFFPRAASIPKQPLMASVPEIPYAYMFSGSVDAKKSTSATAAPTTRAPVKFSIASTKSAMTGPHALIRSQSVANSASTPPLYPPPPSFHAMAAASGLTTADATLPAAPAVPPAPVAPEVIAAPLAPTFPQDPAVSADPAILELPAAPEVSLASVDVGSALPVAALSDVVAPTPGSPPDGLVTSADQPALDPAGAPAEVPSPTVVAAPTLTIDEYQFPPCALQRKPILAYPRAVLAGNCDVATACDDVRCARALSFLGRAEANTEFSCQLKLQGFLESMGVTFPVQPTRLPSCMPAGPFPSAPALGVSHSFAATKLWHLTPDDDTDKGTTDFAMAEQGLLLGHVTFVAAFAVENPVLAGQFLLRKHAIQQCIKSAGRVAGGVGATAAAETTAMMATPLSASPTHKASPTSGEPFSTPQQGQHASPGSPLDAMSLHASSPRPLPEDNPNEEAVMYVALPQGVPDLFQILQDGFSLEKLPESVLGKGVLLAYSPAAACALFLATMSKTTPALYEQRGQPLPALPLPVVIFQCRVTLGRGMRASSVLYAEEQMIPAKFPKNAHSSFARIVLQVGVDQPMFLPVRVVYRADQVLVERVLVYSADMRHAAANQIRWVTSRLCGRAFAFSDAQVAHKAYTMFTTHLQQLGLPNALSCLVDGISGHMTREGFVAFFEGQNNGVTPSDDLCDALAPYFMLY